MRTIPNRIAAILAGCAASAVVPAHLYAVDGYFEAEGSSLQNPGVMGSQFAFDNKWGLGAAQITFRQADNPEEPFQPADVLQSAADVPYYRFTGLTPGHHYVLSSWVDYLDVQPLQVKGSYSSAANAFAGEQTWSSPISAFPIQRYAMNLGEQIASVSGSIHLWLGNVLPGTNYSHHIIDAFEMLDFTDRGVYPAQDPPPDPGGGGGTEGDFNNDSVVDALDIDMLCGAIDIGGPNDPYDVSGDNQVNMGDLDELVLNILGTNYGDTDTDGDVDLSDLGNLATNYEQSPPRGWGQGDFDCDTDVDLNDLGNLATNYGSGQAAAYAEFSALTGVEVPEPAMLSVAGLTGFALLRGRRRRRSV